MSQKKHIQYTPGGIGYTREGVSDLIDKSYDLLKSIVDIDERQKVLDKIRKEEGGDLLEENRRLKKELHQQRFNNKHNLSIDQSVSDKIRSLTLRNEILNVYIEINSIQKDIISKILFCLNSHECCRDQDSSGDSEEKLRSKKVLDSILMLQLEISNLEKFVSKLENEYSGISRAD